MIDEKYTQIGSSLEYRQKWIDFKSDKDEG
jgi:hypothetical protein